MTIYIIINPDQSHPFAKNIKEELEKSHSTGKVLIMTAEQQLKKFLLQKRTPLFSSKYEIHQVMYYQKLRKLFYSSLQYTPSLRWDISKIQDFLSETSCCNFTPLPVSQASALERSDQNIVKGRQLEASLTSTTVPQNDGTNSCAFLSIGIIDKMYEFSSFQKDTVISEITNVIINFPIKFNPYRDTYQFADVYEAYTILFKNHLLSHEMEFSEKLVDNNKLYSFEIQNELERELLKMKCSTVSSSKENHSIFHVPCWCLYFYC